MAPEAPIEQPVEQPVEVFEVPDFDEGKPKKKKGGLKKAIISIVAVVAAAAVVLCVLKFDYVKSAFYDISNQNDKLRDESVASLTDTMVDVMSINYGRLMSMANGAFSSDVSSVNAKAQLVLGDKGEEMLMDVIPVEVEGLEEMIAMIDGSYISLSSSSADQVGKSLIELGIGGQKLLDLGMISDLNAQEVYLTIPVLTDLYLDVSAIFGSVAFPEEMADATGMAQEMMKALPSEEVLNKLLKKYIGLALEQCTNVTKEKDTLSIGDIDQKVTVLTTTIDGDTVLAAGTAVLEALLNDTDVEDIIVNVADSADQDGADIYDEFIEAIEDALDDIEDADGDDMEGEVILTQYLDSQYKTVGVALEFDGDDYSQEIFYYGSATKGNKFACELEVGGYEVLNGTGTNQKDIINGTFSIESRGYEMVTVKVSNFDKNAFKKGDIKGSFEITPDEEIIENFLQFNLNLDEDLPVGAVIGALDLGIKLDINTSETASSIQFSLTDGGEVLAGIKLETSRGTSDVALPDVGDAVDMENIDEWTESLDFVDVLAALEELGVPAEYVDAIEEFLMDGIENGFDIGGSDKREDPAYDDYYDYYY